MSKIKLNYENALVSQREIKGISETLRLYLEKIQKIAKSNNFNQNESSINAPFDRENIIKIKQLAQKKKNEKLKYIIICGIGGSNLGAQAVYEGLRGKLNLFGVKKPKLIFADTVSVALLRDIQEKIITPLKKSEEVMLVLISKSGTTTETIANFEVIYNALKSKFVDIKDRFVAITDRDSKLWEAAKKDNIDALEIPDKIGGRFSIFTSVGLFPLALCGFDIDKFLLGARDMRNNCLEEKENIAIISASLIYAHYKNGIQINNNFFFNPELELLGKWYRQLMGESIGKEKDLNGNIVNIGITPTVAVGSTDLHSLAQLYLGGPVDKFTNFIYAQEKEILNIPKEPLFIRLNDSISKKNIGALMGAIYDGVKATYIKKQLPFMEIVLPKISERVLGEYLQFKMLEMIFLAKLMNLNAFDQPSVEDYKVETKKILDG